MRSSALLDRQARNVAGRQQLWANSLPQFISQPEIARALNINRRSLRRLILAGRFPRPDLVLSKTCLRWRLSAVEEWLAAQNDGGAQ